MSETEDYNIKSSHGGGHGGLALKAGIFMGIFVLLVGVLTVVVFFLVSTTLRSTLTENNEGSHMYQNYQFNPHNSSDSGINIVHLGRNLKGDEYLSYKDGRGRINIISNFGTNKYQCSGTCYCSEESDSRRSGVLAGRIAGFIVAAISTAMAVEIAHMSFIDDCVKRFKERCGKGKKKAEGKVEDCEKVEEKEEFRDTEESKVAFHCRGACVRNVDLFEEEKVNDAKEFNCEMHSMEGEVTAEGLTSQLKDYADHKFKKVFLNDFCQRISERWYYHNTMQVSDGGTLDMMRKAFLCSAGLYGSNPSVECVRKG